MLSHIHVLQMMKDLREELGGSNFGKHLLPK